MTGDDDRAEKHPKWDIPPWELPGNFRLDARPHRGPLLRRLANAAFVCAAVSFYPNVCFLAICLVRSWGMLFGPAVVLGLLGVGLALPTWVLARRDLQEMRKGRTCADGGETRFARDRAVVGFSLGLFSSLWSGTWLLSDYLDI
jgi:hypothetical protein